MQTASTYDRLLGLAAGILGALGVALSAAGAHGGGPSVASAGILAGIHAAALLALSMPSLPAQAFLRRLAGLGIAVGALLFAGDISLRAYAGYPLFPMAAPSGGSLMILSWLVVGAAFLKPPRP